MDGFLNLRKPAGPTSHDLVAHVRRLLHVRRVGHGGTLDPLAEGVLPIGIGQATRLLSFLQEGDKVYRAEVVLGVSTTTYDAEGEVTATRPVPPLARADLEQALASFLGEIQQVPPPFSAIRREGQHSYQRARAGELVSPPPRQVHIFRLELLTWALPTLALEVVCGSGTYVRSLAHDLGEQLGCGAHLRGLLRLRVGPFPLEEAVTPEALAEAAQEGRAEALLLPLELPVRHWPAVQVNEQQARDVRNGLALTLEVEAAGGWVRAHDRTGRLLALLRFVPDKGCWRPTRVFPPPEAAGGEP